mmetsp:Transcript_5072/g.5266  ORF Transcript_5072/g.5266 Transcript_5072/m.5266 type:complete len:160 (-) Transcript_5072:252-731(-)
MEGWRFDPKENHAALLSWKGGGATEIKTLSLPMNLQTLLWEKGYQSVLKAFPKRVGKKVLETRIQISNVFVTCYPRFEKYFKPPSPRTTHKRNASIPFAGTLLAVQWGALRFQKESIPLLSVCLATNYNCTGKASSLLPKGHLYGFAQYGCPWAAISAQ